MHVIVKLFQKIYTICGTLTQHAADQQNGGRGLYMRLTDPLLSTPNILQNKKGELKTKDRK